MIVPKPDVCVSWGQALAWRMERQLLAPVGSESVAGVVRRLGVVPSMDESLAELAVRTRRTASRPGELAEALAEGTVIKAFAFRGAVHYLSPEDGGAYLALRAAGRQWELPSWVEYYRLAPEDWPAFRAAVREALDAGPLTLAELGDAVTGQAAYRHLRPVFDDGAGTLIKPLTWQGDMGFGLPRDGRNTFQRLDTNPRWAGLPDLDVAGPAAVTAYLRTYGPATSDHVHYWLGNGLSAGRKRLTGWLDGLGDRLVPVDVDGTVAHVLREDVAALEAAHPTDPGDQGRARDSASTSRPHDPQGQPRRPRWCRLRHLGETRWRTRGDLARQRPATRRRPRGGGGPPRRHPRR